MSATNDTIYLRAGEHELDVRALVSDLKGNCCCRNGVRAVVNSVLTNVKPSLTAEWNMEMTEGCTGGKYSLRCNPQLGKTR